MKTKYKVQRIAGQWYVIAEYPNGNWSWQSPPLETREEGRQIARQKRLAERNECPNPSQ